MKPHKAIFFHEGEQIAYFNPTIKGSLGRAEQDILNSGLSSMQRCFYLHELHNAAGQPVPERYRLGNFLTLADMEREMEAIRFKIAA